MSQALKKNPTFPKLSATKPARHTLTASEGGSVFYIRILTQHRAPWLYVELKIYEKGNNIPVAIHYLNERLK